MNYEAPEQPNPVTDNEITDSPHFDENAIAAARQVEPIPSPSRIVLFRRGFLRLSSLFFALIILIAVAAVATALIMREPDNQVTNVAETEVQTEASAESEPSPEIKSFAASVTGQKHAARRTRVPRTFFIDDPSRPVARKVGEIRGRFSY